MRSVIFVGVSLVVIVFISATKDGDFNHKNFYNRKLDDFSSDTDNGRSKEFWWLQGQDYLKTILRRRVEKSSAKNVILFLGDGMSLSTVAATRALENQPLSFEKFPHLGFSKTYCINSQVADSACTATAYLSGVKTNYEIIGLNAKAKHKNCSVQADHEIFTESILRWAQKSHKGTGIVTTTRITHASPAGTYAHVSSRHYENDFEMEADGCDSSKFDDIAEQLVYNVESKNFKITLGGGRAGFRNRTAIDEEGQQGYRVDGRDLIEEWKAERSKLGKSSYIFDRDGLINLDIANTDYVLGLFENDHMRFNMDVLSENLQNQKPSLTDMTVAAIKMLQKEENGYFLFVEGGMIDQAHHYNYARYSLDETSEFSKAIEAARQMTDTSDTLIVTTADHSHVFTYSGHKEKSGNTLRDSAFHTTLSYANGPGFTGKYSKNGMERPPVAFDVNDPRAQFPATVPLTKDTHGGDDVGVWASGPMSHLFSGHYDQNAIPLIMAYIMEVGPYAADETGSSCNLKPKLFLLVAVLIIVNFLE